MINNKTVFILGAGASCPFGFPSGNELLKVIDKSLEYTPIMEKISFGNSPIPLSNQQKWVPIEDETKSSNQLFQMLLDLGYSKELILRFKEELRFSQLSSIDAFLEHRSEFINLGKIVIAYNLIKYEESSKEKLFTTSDWYGYLRSSLNAPLDEFVKNKVSFVTYNYDRSLEMYLQKVVSATYGLDNKKTDEILSSIPIIHLHGQLGPIKGEEIIPYGHKVNSKEDLLRIAEFIKVIHEDIKEESFIEANRLLKEAKRILILGFGYHPTNISRLKLDTQIRTKDGHIVTPIGSAYGLTKNEIKRLEDKYRHIRFDHILDRKCLEFLRDYLIT